MDLIYSVNTVEKTEGLKMDLIYSVNTVEKTEGLKMDLDAYVSLGDWTLKVWNLLII